MGIARIQRGRRKSGSISDDAVGLENGTLDQWIVQADMKSIKNRELSQVRTNLRSHSRINSSCWRHQTGQKSLPGRIDSRNVAPLSTHREEDFSFCDVLSSQAFRTHQLAVAEISLASPDRLVADRALEAPEVEDSPTELSLIFLDNPFADCTVRVNTACTPSAE
jgi:hypothetical protein